MSCSQSYLFLFSSFSDDRKSVVKRSITPKLSILKVCRDADKNVIIFLDEPMMKENLDQWKHFKLND